MHAHLVSEAAALIVLPVEIARAPLDEALAVLHCLDLVKVGEGVEALALEGQRRCMCGKVAQDVVRADNMQAVWARIAGVLDPP